MTDDQFMEAMADAVAQFVQRATTPLAGRLDSLESRPPPAAVEPLLDPIRREVAELAAREVPDAMVPLERFANALTAKLLT